MKSMTGYGKGISAAAGLEVAIEMRSVNNRFLEVNTRLPKNFLACDELIRSTVPKYLSRGSVDVFFSYSNSGTVRGVNADIPMIKEYANLKRRIKKETGLSLDISFSTLVNQGLIIQDLKADDSEQLLELTARAAGDALKNLEQMRTAEGEAIRADLIKLIGEIEDGVKAVTERAPLIAAEFRKKISERISIILAGVEIDESRLLNEVAFFADRSDINEELQRLNSHISQFRDTANGSDALGRKLDFICQEIGREINTIGSKSNDITLASTVVEMKNTLEKIKEQVRNVE